MEERPKYTRAKLWLYAFEEAYPNYFRLVDSKGNPRKERHSDFDYFSLSEAEQEMYDKFYSGSCDYLEKEYEKEIEGSYL